MGSIENNVCEGDQRYVDAQLQLLRMALTDLGLPPVMDRTDTPTSHETNDVTMVILADCGEALSILLEGNRQYPGSALFALSLSWLSRQPCPPVIGVKMSTVNGKVINMETSSKTVATETLYVHKAVTADAGGQTFLEVFSPPRRVTYVINHVTGRLNGLAFLGEKLLGYDLDIPLGGSMPLATRFEDKLLMHSMCAEADIAHTATLGFWLADKHDPDFFENSPSFTLVRLTSKNLEANELEPVVRQFLESDQLRSTDKVRVQLSSQPSPSFDKIHPTTDVASVVNAVLELLKAAKRGSGVLVESVATTFDPVVPDGIARHAVDIEGIALDCKVTAVVSRTPQDGARLSQVVCRITAVDDPDDEKNAVPMSLEMMLGKWGVNGHTNQRSVRDAIKRTSEKLLLALMEKESQLAAEERGGAGAQTDIIGIDFVLMKLGDAITPVVTKVRGQGCLEASAVFEMMNCACRGQASRTLVQTMIARSQKFLMKDKVVLVVGAGAFSKRNLWRDAGTFGVKIVLVDSNPNHFARQHVHLFLPHDINDHTKDSDHADAIVRLVQSRVGHVDGCLAISEDYVPLASMVAERLELTHTPPTSSAVAAKQKGLTMKKLNENGIRTPYTISLTRFASPIVRFTTLEELDDAAKKVPFPAVIKMEFGSGGFGVKHVQNVEEARAFVTYVQDNLKSEEEYPGVGLGHGQSFVLMPRLVGTEHNVDVVMFEGQLMAAFVTDHGPTHLPLCQQTAAALPTVLNSEQEKQLVYGVAACCRGLGLNTGVFNVEMMLTPRGPRLIEINARMGGFYLREWVRQIYNVDLFHLALMACCGVRPVATNSLVNGHNSEKVRECSGQVLGVMVYPSRHALALSSTATPEHLRRLHDQGAIYLAQIEPNVVQGSCEYEEPFCNLAVHAPTLEEARAKLVGTCQALDLETEDTLNYILQDFIHA